MSDVAAVERPADSTGADALVLFGATGDLAKRKLFPALAKLAAAGRLECPVIGVARSEWHDQEFRDHARGAVLAAWPDVPAEVLDRLCGRLHLVTGDYGQLSTFDALATTLAEHGARLPVHYLAIPPALFPTVVESLSLAGLTTSSRLVVEKPFGRDLASARELNRVLHAHLDESQVFRIDHYLGKESVEDLLVFRFTNSMFEPLWNRNHVESVQIAMAESIGVEGRGSFYDSVGALRDVVQNHLLQVVALLAMEPPVGPEPKHLADEKVKVFAAMRPLDCASLVRGQYAGYLDEPGVAPGSTTETYVAARFEIDSWRWAGVPFFVRAGKGLAASATEAVVVLREPPQQLFNESGPPGPARNLLRFVLGRNDGVTFTLNAKAPGPELDSQPVDISVDFASALGRRAEAYERLLGDAIDGNPRRFGREDMVEETWRVLQPALDRPGPVYPYAMGSWGPAEADAVPSGPGWLLPKAAPSGGVAPGSGL